MDYDKEQKPQKSKTKRKQSESSQDNGETLTFWAKTGQNQERRRPDTAKGKESSPCSDQNLAEVQADLAARIPPLEATEATEREVGENGPGGNENAEKGKVVFIFILFRVWGEGGRRSPLAQFSFTAKTRLMMFGILAILNYFIV